VTFARVATLKPRDVHHHWPKKRATMARIAQDSGREPPNLLQIHAHHALKS